MPTPTSEPVLTPLEAMPWMMAAGEALGSSDPALWAVEQRWREEVPWSARRAFWSHQGMNRLPPPTVDDPVPAPWRHWLAEMKQHACEETGDEHRARWGRWRHTWGVDAVPPPAFMQALAELGPLGWLDADPDTGESPALALASFAQAQTWMTHLAAVPAWNPHHTDHAGNQLWATWLMRVALDREQGEHQEAAAVAAWTLDHPRDGVANGQSLWSWLAPSELLGNAWRTRNGVPPQVCPSDQARAAVLNQKLTTTQVDAVLTHHGPAIWDSVPGRLRLDEAWLRQSRVHALQVGEAFRFWTQRGVLLRDHGWRGDRPEALREWAQACPMEKGVPSLVQEKGLSRWATVMAALLTDASGNLLPTVSALTQGGVRTHVAKGVFALRYLEENHPLTHATTGIHWQDAWRVTQWPATAVAAVADALEEAPWSNPDSLAQQCAQRARHHWQRLTHQALARERQHQVVDTGPTQPRRRLRS